MTNFRAEDLPESANGGGLNLKVGAHTISRLVETFANCAADEPIAYVGSSGYLEIAINKANASRKLAIARGTPVTSQELIGRQPAISRVASRVAKYSLRKYLIESSPAQPFASGCADPASPARRHPTN